MSFLDRYHIEEFKDMLRQISKDTIFSSFGLSNPYFLGGLLIRYYKEKLYGGDIDVYSQYNSEIEILKHRFEAQSNFKINPDKNLSVYYKEYPSNQMRKIGFSSHIDYNIFSDENSTPVENIVNKFDFAHTHWYYNINSMMGAISDMCQYSIKKNLLIYTKPYGNISLGSFIRYERFRQEHKMNPDSNTKEKFDKYRIEMAKEIKEYQESRATS